MKKEGHTTLKRELKKQRDKKEKIEMQKITEEDKIHEEWYKEAKSITLDKLPFFLNHIMNDYEHDYGTIVHAMTAGAIATTWAMNKDKQGGITGFQASCLMWDFIQHWMHYDMPMKLIRYDDMLYPQYEPKFEKSISKDTWGWLQEEAQKLINTNGGFKDMSHIHPDVLNHWKSIVAGKIPFGYTIKEE